MVDSATFVRAPLVAEEDEPEQTGGNGFHQVLKGRRLSAVDPGASPISLKATTPEQQDALAWAEIGRRRGLGQSDKDIWLGAASRGEIEILGAFVRKPPAGFDINATDVTGQTALHKAMTLFGFFLLPENRNGRNDKDARAFGKARTLDILKLLIGTGKIDLAKMAKTHPSDPGLSAWSIAAQFTNVPEMQEIAGYLKTELNAEAQAAQEKGDQKRVDELVAAGADRPQDKGKPVDELDEKTRSKINKLKEEGYELIDENGQKDLHLLKTKFLDGDYEADDLGIQAYELNGKKYMVVETMDPDYYEYVVGRRNTILQLRRHEERGFIVVKPGDPVPGKVLSVKRIAGQNDQMLTFETEVGAYFVHEELNKEVYAHAKAAEDGDLPETDNMNPTDLGDRLKDIDVFSMETTEKDASGKPLTVSALTIDNIMTKYREGIEKGDIKSDDARYKFYYAVLAQNDISNGRTIIPYRENGTKGTSERWEGNPVDATPEDMEDMYKLADVSKLLDEMSRDPQVAKDYEEAQKAALDKLPNKDKIKGKIEALVRNGEFKSYLDNLHKTGKQDQAIEISQRIFASYSVLASEEEVNDLMEEVATTQYVEELNAFLDDPTKIEDSNWVAGTTDIVQMILEMLNRTVQFGRHGLNSLKLAETKAWLSDIKTNKAKLAALSNVFKELSKLKGIDVLEGSQKFNQAINDAIAKAKVPVAERGGMSKFFSNLNNAGAFSTVIGTLAITSSIYQLTKGKHGSGEHMQNLQIARGFMLFLGTTPEMAKWGSSLTKYAGLSRFLGSGDTSAIFGAKTLQEIYKVTAPKWVTTLTGELDKISPIEIDPKYASGNIVDRLSGKISGALGGNGNNLGTKFAAGAIKVMGAAGFTAFGIVDGVLGGLTLKQGIDNGDKTIIAQGAMQIATGAFSTGAGIAMGLQAAGFTTAGMFISPFLLAAATIGLGIVFIDLVKALINAFREDDTASLDQLDYFNKQAGLNLLQGDWGRKLEFMVLNYYGEDSRSGGEGFNSKRPDTPEGKSVFDHYDWQRWLTDYERLHDEDYELPNGPPPLTEMTPEYAEVQGKIDQTLNEMASYYRRWVDFDKRTIPGLGNDYLKERFKLLVEYYLLGKDVERSKEAAARWAWQQLIARVPGAFADHPDVKRVRKAGVFGIQTDSEYVKASEEVLTMLNNNWNSHGGRQDAEEIADELV
jgi:hypothetical protein